MIQDWHRYPKEKPKEYDDYLVFIDDGVNAQSIDIYTYDPKLKQFGYLRGVKVGQVEWKSIDGCVAAWMPMPEWPDFWPELNETNQ